MIKKGLSEIKIKEDGRRRLKEKKKEQRVRKIYKIIWERKEGEKEGREALTIREEEGQKGQRERTKFISKEEGF